MRDETDLAIVICTFHREALLEKALASIAGQFVPAGLLVKIIVADNSDRETARPVAERAMAASPVPVHYVAAHPANISLARNAGVAAAAAARWVAFLDDDQEMQPGWICAAAQAIARPEFDAYFGAVEPIFEAPALATPMTQSLFSRLLPATAGDELFAMGPQKTRGIALATNNSIFRTSVLGPAPFDPVFGDGGGEDYDLICRMQSRGSRLGWLPAARATEFVPAKRCDTAYLRRRFFAGGQAFARSIINASPKPQFARRRLQLRALVQLGLLAATYPRALLRGDHARADHSFLIAGARGKLSPSKILPIYREQDGSQKALVATSAANSGV